MKLSTKEQVIMFLLSLEREYKSNNIQTSVSRNKFNDSDISNIGENEFINQLSILETAGLITVNFSTGHRDLKYYITVILHEPILNYFDNKKKNVKHIIWELVKFLIPTIISIIALVIAA